MESFGVDAASSSTTTSDAAGTTSSSVFDDGDQLIDADFATGPSDRSISGDGVSGDPAGGSSSDTKVPRSRIPMSWLGETLVRGESPAAPTERCLSSVPYVALYFAGAWSPPCRQFLPKLLKTYEELNSRGPRLEIVYVTLERDQAAFKESFAEMPWVAMQLHDAVRLGARLMDHLEITTLPCLVVLKKGRRDMRVVTMRAVQRILRDPAGRYFPWKSII